MNYGMYGLTLFALLIVAIVFSINMLLHSSFRYPKDAHIKLLIDERALAVSKATKILQRRGGEQQCNALEQLYRQAGESTQRAESSSHTHLPDAVTEPAVTAQTNVCTRNQQQTQRIAALCKPLMNVHFNRSDLNFLYTINPHRVLTPAQLNIYGGLVKYCERFMRAVIVFGSELTPRLLLEFEQYAAKLWQWMTPFCITNEPHSTQQQLMAVKRLVAAEHVIQNGGSPQWQVVGDIIQANIGAIAGNDVCDDDVMWQQIVLASEAMVQRLIGLIQ